MQLGYEGGISLQISFAILAGATFFYFINTFIFLPKRHIPWPLPPDYGEKKKKKYGSDSVDLAEKNKEREEVVDERKAVEISNAEGRETRRFRRNIYLVHHIKKNVIVVLDIVLISFIFLIMQLPLMIILCNCLLKQLLLY